MASKICWMCKIDKSIDEFFNDKSKKDQKQSLCKTCRNTYNKKYYKDMRINNPIRTARYDITIALSHTYTGHRNRKIILNNIGIDFNLFKIWITYQFTEEMTLANYGDVWCFDHVIPLSSYNLLNQDELLEATNWVNIRPCIKIKNSEKHSKIDNYLSVMQELKSKFFIKYLKSLDNKIINKWLKE